MGSINIEKGTKQDKQRLIDTEDSTIVTRGEEGVVGKGKGAQIYGDKQRFDFGWQTHNAVYR